MNKTIFAISSFALIAGCTPHQGHVTNIPPVIEESLSVADYSMQNGYFQPEIFSAFFWPSNWTKQDYIDRVGQIQDDGKALIGMLVKNEDAPLITINQLWMGFKQNQCIENFQDQANVSPVFDPSDETSAVDFVVIPVVAPVDPVPATDIGYAKYQEYQAYLAKVKGLKACTDNQNQRIALHQGVDQFLSQDPQPVAVLQGKINALLGSAQSLVFDVTNSHFILKASEDPSNPAPTLSIQLKFTDLAKTVSTEKTDARSKIIVEHVAVKGNRIVFSVPDPTTASVMYHFDLSRMNSLVKLYHEYEVDGSTKPTELAVFQGDLARLENGVATQVGQVQIVGKFQGAAVAAAPANH